MVAHDFCTALHPFCTGIYSEDGEKKKAISALFCEALLLCCLCVTVSVCVLVMHRRAIHHILFTVFP